VVPDYGPGPMEGLDAFLSENRDFEVDVTREKFYFTFNPRGYLRRLR
jgi:cephalosporin hydroxylase